MQCLEDLIHQYNENNNNIDNGESFSYRTSNISFNGKDKRHYHEVNQSINGLYFDQLYFDIT